MTNRSGSVLLMALVCTLATLGGSCCDRRITSKQVSPSGKMVAIVTATHCGPPGGDGTAITIRAAKKSFFEREAMVCGADEIHSIGVLWKDDQTLIVDLPKSVFGRDFVDRKIGVQNSDVNGVHIEYRTF